MSVDVVTFGCRLNAAESEVIRREAERAGLRDTVVVNTCAVTAEAVRQARQTIRALRRQRPLAKIVVTGCAAQTQSAMFAEMIEVDRVNAYYISVDPERDTQAAMKEYLSSFDPRLKGLTGNAEEIAKVLSEYRVYAKKVPLKDGDYTMDHTALVYLMDRDGKFVSPFNINRKPEDAASDLKPYL